MSGTSLSWVKVVFHDQKMIFSKTVKSCVVDLKSKSVLRKAQVAEEASKLLSLLLQKTFPSLYNTWKLA